ncbi:hypothetical protein BASA81_000971 [Batrachochytrium salamandrivorans]|nr:hypothetical protein BASA81_000971 [Batrachochytrium salamandrivorans]
MQDSGTRESTNNSHASSPLDQLRFSSRFRKKSLLHSSSSSSPQPPTAASSSTGAATAAPHPLAASRSRDAVPIPTTSRRRSFLLRLFFSKKNQLSPTTMTTAATTSTLSHAVETASNPLFAIEPFDLNLLFKDEHVNYTNGSVRVKNKYFEFDGEVLRYATGLVLTPELSQERDVIQLFPLGTGSSSTVFACLNTNTFNVFALKETKILDSIHPVRQAQQEIQALKELIGNDHIVQFHCAYVNPKTCTIGLEISYEFAGSVAQLIAQRGKVDEPFVRQIGKDIANALISTHALGVAHCDVKPANILISRGFERFVLCDFGLARSFIQQELVSFTGTTKYMSPERLLGLSYSAAADIWALGLVLCACANGKYPLPLESNLGEEAVFFAVLQHFRECGETSQPFATLPSEFPTSAKLFVQSCLRLKPQDRPTAKELLVEFEWITNPQQSAPKRVTNDTSNFNLFQQVCSAINDQHRDLQHVELLPQHVAALANQFQLPEPTVRLQLEAALGGVSTLNKSSLLPHSSSSPPPCTAIFNDDSWRQFGV